MRANRLGVSLAVLLTAAACTTTYGPKETGGTLIGAGLGGLAGSQIGHGTGRLVATGAGVLLGAWLGSEIGRSLDRADRMAIEQSTNQALEYNPDGQRAEWNNPNTGHSGYTTPTRTFENQAGQPCREYQTAVVIGGKTESAYGTACRQSDGSWRIVS